MRKLCHPQVGAVAHVLSSSPFLEVSPDMSLVRPGRAPPMSPARSHAKRHANFKVHAREFEPPTVSETHDFSLMT